ncbi:MAG: hypothetical protein ACLPTZ_11340 [Beijerinckiaceae bacterium]
MFCDAISAADPLIDANAPPSIAAKDIPAIPNTDTALLRRFPFEEHFSCDIAEFLLFAFPPDNARQNTASVALLVGFEKHAASRFAAPERLPSKTVLFSVAPSQKKSNPP